MARRIGEGTTFVRGVYIDEEILEMAKALARVKKTSINQVFREGVVKLYKQEIGETTVQDIQGVNGGRK